MSSAISGNAGLASAVVTLAGAAQATTTADGVGAYSFAGLADGIYYVTPSAPSGSNAAYTPTNRKVVVAGGDQSGIDFTALANVTGFSPVDSRTSPNTGEVLSDGSVAYDVQTSSNVAVPSADSRAISAPVDSRVAKPVNSRVS